MLVTVRSSVVIRANSCVINSVTSRAHTRKNKKNGATGATERCKSLIIKRSQVHERVKMVLPTCTDGATKKYVTLLSKRSLLRVEAKLLYRGKVTDGKGQTPIAAGSKRPSRNLTGLPKTPYEPTQNTLRLYSKQIVFVGVKFPHISVLLFINCCKYKDYFR